MRRHASVLVFLALLGAGCATTIRAQVLDAETRQPIPGAVVLGVWTKVVGIGLSHSELVGVRETETDADGRFELERLGRPGFRRDESITIYKFGHVAWNNELLFPIRERDDKGVPKEILLDRFPHDESHQKHMIFINNAVGESLDRSSMTPKFSNAIREEMKLP